jgi:hypothetical protein
LLVIGGSSAAVLAVSVFRRRPVISMLGWMVLSFWLFLGHGGVVLDFYLVPLLPLLALCLALVAGECVSALQRKLPGRPARMLGAAAVSLVGCGCLVGVAAGYEHAGHGLFTKRPVDAQVRAARWVQTHLPPTSTLIIDMYMFADLHYPQAGAPAFPRAEYYWKVADDPEVARHVLHGDWRNVDYVVTTPQLTHDAAVNGLPIVVLALVHSLAIADFNSGGWDVEIRRVDPRITVSSFASQQHQKLPNCMTST